MTATNPTRQETTGAGPWVETLRRLTADRWNLAMLVLVGIYGLLSLLVGLGLVAGGWNEQVGASFLPPSWEHPCGTDLLGRSVLSKALYGARTSFSVALLGTLISSAMGALLGGLAGYFRGFVDEVIVAFYSTVSAVPGLLLIIALAFVLRDATLWGLPLRGVPALSLALGLVGWVGTCRLVRGEVIKQRGLDYVLAARALGCSRLRILWRHIFPNVAHLVIIQMSLQAVGFVKAEVMLSFLGLGPMEEPSWGVMIDDARFDMARGVWWQMAVATAAVFFLSLALNVVGDAIRDALDPKLARGRRRGPAGEA